MNIFKFWVTPKQESTVQMESLGFNERDAQLYLEQQLKKCGFSFEEIQPVSDEA